MEKFAVLGAQRYPLVSVIIPVYNVEKFIERCARSLYEQTYSNIEYIWVNDQSQDSSKILLEQVTSQYPNRQASVLILDNKDNLGPLESRHIGLSRASGEFVYFCDSDDWVDSEMLEELVVVLMEEQSDIVWCDYYLTYSDTDRLVDQSGGVTSIECIRNLLAGRMHGGYPFKFLRRSLYVHNNINYTSGANICEDLRGSVQLFYFAHKISYYPKAFYHYVQDNQGSLCTSFSTKKLSDILANIDGIIRFLEDKNIARELQFEINCLKHLGKRSLLITTDIKNFRRWRTIYPEANKYILSYTALPFSLRLIGWCAYMKLWLPVRIWIFLKKMNKKNL